MPPEMMSPSDLGGHKPVGYAPLIPHQKKGSHLWTSTTWWN